MKLALHRSITFWSGLLVMAFICWAWWDSASFRSDVSMGRFGMASNYGGIVTEDVLLNSGLGFDYSRDLHRLHGPSEIFPSPCLVQRKSASEAELIAIADPYRKGQPITVEQYLKYRMDLITAPEWVIFIPYWLILLTVAAVWLLLLFLRARRRNKSVMKQLRRRSTDL